MELKQLRCLVACAQTRSFNKAANLLYTAQSNISRTIRNLEEELGIDLFERKHYGIELTEDGRKIYEYALATLKSAEKIEEFTKLKIREELRIASNPSSWMAAAFRDYFREYEREDVSYYFMTASSNDIIRRLASEIDQIGFVYIMEAQMEDFRARLARNHITFIPLKETSALLYFGNEKARESYENPKPDEKRPALVQCYEDEFTLQSFWHQEERRNAEEWRRKSDIETQEESYPRVAVTTNSDYVMSELLRYTRLGNISGGYLSGHTERKDRYALPLYEGQEGAWFGCLIRNDRELGKLQLDYLSFIKERLQKDN